MRSAQNMIAGDTRRFLAYCAVLFVLSFLLYSPSLGNDFVWDAEIAFTQDPSIREWKFIADSFQEPTFQHLPTDGANISSLDYYRPLIKILHIAEHQWFGTEPFAYKAMNVLLNGLVVVLLFVFLSSALKDRTTALLATLLYLANPTRAEAVYWAYSDSYLIVALFALAALVLYQRRLLWAAFVAYACALLSHEMAILLPVIVALYIFLIEQQRHWRSYLPAAGFLALAVAYLLLRTTVIGSVPLASVDAATYLNTAVVVVQRYVKMLLLPDALVGIYPNELFHTLTREVLVSYLVVGLLGALGILLWFKRRSYLFWYLWFFIWIAVSFNIGEFGAYLIAEKILYLASAGLLVLIVLFISELPFRQSVAYALVLGIALFHAAHVLARAPYWKNSEAYLEKAVEFAPDFYLARYALGNTYVKSKAFDKALEQFARAVEVNPGLSLAHNNMGNIYYLRRDYDQAVAAWKQAVATDPQNPMPYYNIGLVLVNTGDPAQALFYFEQYVAKSPRPDPRAIYQINRLRALKR